MKKGIDVSKYQLNIDWEQVKNNIDFAIIRCGFGKYESQKDQYFERNYSECKRLNIPLRCLSLHICKKCYRCKTRG